MGTEALRKALENKNTDDFEVGTVVRWLSGGKYTYAAVKTPVGWFTTASAGNRYVDANVSYEELVELLSRSEVADVMVAAAWEKI